MNRNINQRAVAQARRRGSTMPKYFIKYFDIIEAETIEDAKDILMEQLMLDVRNDDAEGFTIEEYVE